jgi:hypothetical protein
MSATAAQVAEAFLDRGGWALVAESSSGRIYRRPDAQPGAARIAHIGARGRVELRRADGVTVVKGIPAAAHEQTARTAIRKALGR